MHHSNQQKSPLTKSGRLVENAEKCFFFGQYAAYIFIYILTYKGEQKKQIVCIFQIELSSLKLGKSECERVSKRKTSLVDTYFS